MGILSKIFKPFKKVFKKIGKAIKRGFKKVGKWFGKLGVFGQIALSFIPGLGPMLSGLFKGLGQGALRILQTGLKSSSALVRGASWVVDTARKVVGGIQKGFKTVTSAATSFVKNTARFVGKKLGMNIAGPSRFFGTDGNSVFGRVGKEVTDNFADFKDAVGGMFENPTTRADLISDKLNTTKIGGVKVDTKDLDAQLDSASSDPQTFRKFQEQQDNQILEIGEGFNERFGAQGGYNFQQFSNSMIENATKAGSTNPFGDTLKFITEESEYVTKLASGTMEQFQEWDKWNKGIKDAVDPLKAELKTTIGSSLETKPSLLDKVKSTATSSIASVPGNLLTTAVTQAAGLGAQPLEYAEQTRNALDIYTPRTPFTQLPESQYGFMNTSIPTVGADYASPTDYIGGFMSNEGMQGGMYGTFNFPSYNYGMQTQTA